MANYNELDVEEIIQWPFPAQLVVLSVLLLALQAVGYWWYLDEKRSDLTQLKQQEQTLKQTLQVKANQVAALPHMQDQLDELSERYQYLSQQLPMEKELATMLASVNEEGLKNKLTFTRIDWGSKENQNFLYRLPLNIELTGDYDNIGQFSQAIASLSRIINFVDVDWQRVSLESKTLHFRVRAFTYQFKPEVKDES
ncbi:type 4a pilus biogenesis protein PilO [Vibrio renipiscarius]|uniref:Fimbrial protein n=1 Tax=Vibrio renipiscarius TaxID=1461322 RepID=A0A0C2NN62_9VIBR|nr:type 4a pilus biogenesis protein PilO [Vibrio renipiscarius]KII77715.1 fimbrial protein [Vibrio renipiscarius]KII81539.1 fimbrial protein [Vibrio renipiscarius]